MTRVLVTGGAGFIGKHAVRALLDRGAEVIVAGRSGRAPEGAEARPVDLLDRGAPAALIAETRPDTLLHLAWETRPGKFWTADTNLPWKAASQALLDAFLDRGGRRAVFAGSCAEYDWSALGPEGVAREDTTPLVPATPYGRAKAAMFEIMAERIAAGASCAWGRIFLLYGEDEHPDRFVSSIARGLLSGRPAELTSGRQVRDLMDVRDAGRAFAELALGATSGAVNIATGAGVRLVDVAKTLAETIGRPELLRIGAIPDRPNEPPALVADVQRLTDEVGYRPRCSLEDGLAHAIDYWRGGSASVVTL